MADIRAIFAALPADKQAAHQANFRAIYTAIEKMTVDHHKARGSKPRVFEVHHAAEHARKHYLEAMQHNSASPWLCKRAVVSLYPGHESLFEVQA